MQDVMYGSTSSEACCWTWADEKLSLKQERAQEIQEM